MAATDVTATFWVETVHNPDGCEFNQMQYTQRMLLTFNGLKWPKLSSLLLNMPFSSRQPGQFHSLNKHLRRKGIDTRQFGYFDQAAFQRGKKAITIL